MADNVVVEVQEGVTANVSSEEITTLNGGAVAAQQVQRALLAVRTGDGAAADSLGDADGIFISGTALAHLLAIKAAVEAVAHDAVDTGNPLKIGGRASTAAQAAVANGDRANASFSVHGGLRVVLTKLADGTEVPLAIDTSVIDDDPFTVDEDPVTPIGFLADDTSSDAVGEGDAGIPRMQLNRVQIAQPYESLVNAVSGRAAITDGSSTSVIAAQGAGFRVYVTSVIISNSSVTPAEVDIRDGTAGAVLATFPAPGNKMGVVHSLPMPLRFSDNTIAAADPDAALTTIKVTLIGFKSTV